MTTTYPIALVLISSAIAACATVRGVVIDPSGAPVSDAKVNLTEVYRAGEGVVDYVVTDSSGRFTIANVPLGTYFVHAQKVESGYGDPAFAFFAAGSPAFPEIKIERRDQEESATINLGKPGGILEALLMDANTGASVKNARYRLAVAASPQLYISSSATEDGRIVTPVPPLALNMKVTAPGYDPAFLNHLRIESGSRRTLVIAMKKQPMK